MLKKITLLRERVEDWTTYPFISTHSPILLGYPGAQILSFDDGRLHEIAYEDTAPMQIVRHFVNDRDSFLDELFQHTSIPVRRGPEYPFDSTIYPTPNYFSHLWPRNSMSSPKTT